jgi:signal transduction histidine kinase
MAALLAAVLICLAVTLGAVAAACSAPWMGLSLVADGATGQARIAAVDPGGPAAGLRAPAVLERVGPEPVGAGDLIEESDFMETYTGVETFFGRQTRLVAELRRPLVPLTVAQGGERRTVLVAPLPRPVRALPALFWLQLAFGAGGLLIGAWVLALRPGDWGARMFALTGLSLMVSTSAAAIYSTRELALDGTLERVLSAFNHIGANIFGGAMIALFLSYPRQLCRRSRLLLIPALIVPWQALDIAHRAFNPQVGSYLPTLVEMITILGLIVVQWFANKGDPRSRAALRWLGLSVLVGAGGFVVAVSAPVLVGGPPVIPQGVGLGFFLLIYVGLALGLRRYRLFQLDEWAFRITFYTAGAVALLAVDAGLVLAVGLAPAASLGLALLAVGFAYLPLRDVAWRRLALRRALPEGELFREAVETALAADPAARAQRWGDLLQRLYQPLTLEPAGAGPAEPALEEDGLALVIPAVVGAPPLRLRYPWGGKGLFGPRDLATARQAIGLVAQAEASRTAYDRGVVEERRRIARDLHDDVGARLLSSLHQPDLRETRQTLRQAITEVRLVVGGLAGERRLLADVLADLRHETTERLEGAGLALDWPLLDVAEVGVDYPVHKNLTSAVREVVTNVIRHAGATALRVEIAASPGSIRIAMTDDGRGLSEGGEREGASGGRGLKNMANRLAEIGGAIAFPPIERGTRVVLDIPLTAAAPVQTVQAPA